MLSINEVRNLENKWKIYKRKKYLKIFIYIFIILILTGVFILYSYDFFNNNLKIKILKPIKQSRILEKNSTKDIISAKTDKCAKKIFIDENNNTPTIKSLKDISKKTKVKNTQNINILQLNTSFLSHIYDEKDSAKKAQLKTVKELNNSKNNFTKEKYLLITQASVKQLKQGVQPFVKQESKKSKIIISSKKIDKLEYLKEQYNETKKAFYAILISQEYYKKKFYSKSLLWATTANNIDSSNEDSWIMFAKSKVKLGKRNDAINALSAFLKVNNSQKIKILLTNIKNGVFK